ncbi:uncharacterized protein LOC129220942 [Uloborus diversus]|uniref:uncharacterized protein LOC129220942 n=1 Tax=Uloborus diversus TaxID=327109 RepID=UPI0024095042|nr:uncharacterized protein LOC129220942 [Uloborus diversus]
MTIDFYQIPASPPCRAVTFTAQQLGVKLNEKYVDLLNGEHLKPEFLKMNPQHTVPTIDDDGFYLFESRAIQAYLVNKYAPNHALYPQDPQKRAAIDKVLYFDSSLFAILKDIMISVLRKGEPPKPESLEAMQKQLQIFEEFLGKTSYAAADYLTLADFSLVTNIEQLKVIDFDLSVFPRINAWMQKLKKEVKNYHEINEVPVQKFKEHLASRKQVMTSIDVYQIPPSPPCRTVLMTANHLGIKVNQISVDLFNGDQMKPEFLRMNPLHTVPTIDDDGFYLSESRAIQAYLVNKYSPNNPIYPEDPQQRAVIDMMLNFDVTLFNARRDYVTPQWRNGEPPKPERLENYKKYLRIFDEILGTRKYAAADHITLADFALIANVSFTELVEFDFDEFPRISAWMKKLKNEIPNYHEINDVPIQNFKEFIKSGKQVLLRPKN